MGAIKAAIGDAVLTFMWVFSASTLGAATTVTARALGIEGLVWPSVFITTVLVFFLVFVFTLIGDALGGASFNPTGTASFYAAGLGPDTLFSMALRFPAQVFSFSFSVSQFHLTNNITCMPPLCFFIFCFLYRSAILCVFKILILLTEQIAVSFSFSFFFF
jgi:hypothetical protein